MLQEDEIIQLPDTFSVSAIDPDVRCGAFSEDAKKASPEEIAVLEAGRARVATFKNSVVERQSIAQAMETIGRLMTILDACKKLLGCKRYEDLTASIEALKKEGK